MKKTDFFKKLSDLTKIPADKLTELISSDQEELDIDFPELHVYTDEELETLKINLNKATSKTAVEMSVKAARAKLVELYGDEFNFQDKNPETLMEYALKAGEKKANVKPNEKLQESEKIIKTLQDNLKQLETEKVQILNEKNQILLDYDLNSTITQAIPSDVETIWTKDEMSYLFKKEYEIIIEDGKKVARKNGEIIRNPKTQEPEPVDKVVNTWLLNKGISAEQRKGRGEVDSKGKQTKTEFSTIDEINKYAEENKLDNDQTVELVRKAMKDNPNLGA